MSSENLFLPKIITDLNITGYSFSLEPLDDITEDVTLKFPNNDSGYLLNDGSGNLSWDIITEYNQSLNTTDNVSFDSITTDTITLGDNLNNALVIQNVSNPIITISTNDTTEYVNFAYPILLDNISIPVSPTNKLYSVGGNLFYGNQQIAPIATGYTRTEINTSTYTALNLDFILGVTYTTTGTAVITLPEISILGEKIYHIVDEGGNASVNNITINTTNLDTINGSSSIVIDSNNSAISIYNDNNTGWFVF